MSNRNYKSDLSTDGIKRIITQLKQYSDVDLPKIADIIVRRLSEMGIAVAKSVVYDDWRQYIEFQYVPMKLGAGNLTAWDIKPVHRIWYSSKKKGAKKKEADVSALWMSEYGAGWYALTGHRGSFPGQTQAFKSEWFWYDTSGRKHSSEEDYHMIATQPMYRAFVEMMVNVDRVAREVFSLYGYSR